MNSTRPGSEFDCFGATSWAASAAVSGRFGSATLQVFIFGCAPVRSSCPSLNKPAGDQVGGVVVGLQSWGRWKRIAR